MAGGGLAGAAPGSRVDVVVSTEAGAGGPTGHSFVALADVELLGLGQDTGAALGDSEEPGPAVLATLRVTTRQAVYLTAADNFGREIRLLLRPAGDSERVDRSAVGAGEL